MGVPAERGARWDEDEVVGRGVLEGQEADDAWSVTSGSLLSGLLATVASLLWQGTAAPWQLVGALALAATAVAALAALRAWWRRVRSLLSLVLLLVCLPTGPTVLSWVFLGLLLGTA